MRLTSFRLLPHLAVRLPSWTSIATSELTTTPTVEAVESLPLTLWVWFILFVCHCLNFHFLVGRWFIQAGVSFDCFYNAQLLTLCRHSVSNGADAEHKHIDLNPGKINFPAPNTSLLCSRWLIYWVIISSSPLPVVVQYFPLHPLLWSGHLCSSPRLNVSTLTTLSPTYVDEFKHHVLTIVLFSLDAAQFHCSWKTKSSRPPSNTGGDF